MLLVMILTARIGKVTIKIPGLAGATQGSPADGEVFSYVPGAGDDEESWAFGLTPKLFWDNRQAIL